MGREEEIQEAEEAVLEAGRAADNHEAEDSADHSNNSSSENAKSRIVRYSCVV